MTDDQEENPRELLGVIKTSNGKSYNVYMPITSDFYFEDLQSKNITFIICAKAVEISIEEFGAWAIMDSMKVVNMVNMAIEILP